PRPDRRRPPADHRRDRRAAAARGDLLPRGGAPVRGRGDPGAEEAERDSGLTPDVTPDVTSDPISGRAAWRRTRRWRWRRTRQIRVRSRAGFVRLARGTGCRRRW